LKIFIFTGSGNDVKTVKNFFEDTLKFKVEVEQDLTLDNLKTELKGVKEQISGERRKRYYCFILVIMGHGNEVNHGTRESGNSWDMGMK